MAIPNEKICPNCGAPMIKGMHYYKCSFCTYRENFAGESSYFSGDTFSDDFDSSQNPPPPTSNAYGSAYNSPPPTSSSFTHSSDLNSSVPYASSSFPTFTPQHKNRSMPVKIGFFVFILLFGVGLSFARDHLRSGISGLFDFMLSDASDEMPSNYIPDSSSFTNDDDPVTITSPTLVALLEYLYGTDIWSDTNTLSAQAYELACQVRYISVQADSSNNIAYFSFSDADYRDYATDDEMYTDLFLEQAVTASYSSPSILLNLSDPFFDELSCFANLNFLSTEGIPIPENMSLANLTALSCDRELEVILASGMPIKQIEYLELGMPQHINGINYFTSLTHLEFDASQTVSLAPISTIGSLEYLSLYNSPETDYEFLSNLTQLRMISIASTSEVSDVSVLKTLRNLEKIQLYNTGITNLEFLRDAPSLTQVLLYENASLADISALESHPNLHSLLLIQPKDNAGALDASVIGDLHNVENLQLGYLSNITFLNHLNKLKFLELEGINDDGLIESIATIPNLQTLYLDSCTDTSVSTTPLTFCTSLEELGIWNMSVTPEVFPLFELPNLSVLTLIECAFPTLPASVVWSPSMTTLFIRSPYSQENAGAHISWGDDTVLLSAQEVDNLLTSFSQIDSLTNLYISECAMPNTSALTAFDGLTRLCLLNCSVQELTEGSFANLLDLEYIDLGNNEIVNIDALTGLTKLATVYLNDNNISDITPLGGLTKLIYVNLANNPITINPLPEEVVDMTQP
jgi:hypothetical protein